MVYFSPELHAMIYLLQLREQETLRLPFAAGTEHVVMVEALSLRCSCSCGCTEWSAQGSSGARREGDRQKKCTFQTHMPKQTRSSGPVELFAGLNWGSPPGLTRSHRNKDWLPDLVRCLKMDGLCPPNLLAKRCRLLPFPYFYTFSRQSRFIFGKRT